jgi:hypothetical protein
MRHFGHSTSFHPDSLDGFVFEESAADLCQHNHQKNHGSGSENPMARERRLVRSAALVAPILLWSATATARRMDAWRCISALCGSAVAAGCASIPTNAIHEIVMTNLAVCVGKLVV